MKSFLPTLPVFILFAGLTLYGNEACSQTAGTFSFTVTTTSTGGYSPSHLIAIWIENSATAFIKTKIKYASPSNYDHIQTWVNKSNQNVVDAVTGPTLTSHGTLTFLWNGTDVSGTLVPDGSYLVWLEMAWASSLTTGKTVNSYAFTKGPTLFTSNPANTANFLSLGLTWTPSTTPVESVMENASVKIYPNPTTGKLTVDFKEAAASRNISVVNEAGIIVFRKVLDNSPSGPEEFDFRNLKPGTYFMSIQTQNNNIVFAFIRTK